jgi:hypothetical protein
MLSELREAKLAGACDRFGAPLDLEFAEDLAIVGSSGIPVGPLTMVVGRVAAGRDHQE